MMGVTLGLQVDGLVGFYYISTSTSVDVEEHCCFIGSTWQCSDDGDWSTNLDDFVFSAGGGGGVQIALDASGAARPVGALPVRR